MKDMLPKEGESQEIGKKAGRAFASKLPDAWSEKDLDGDTDYGLDYQVQVKDENSLITANFYLQLKGTTVPNFVNNNSEISFQFDSSTLNYYRNNEPVVIVALVDLSAAERPRDCPVYYKCLDEDFLDSISDKIQDNDKVSIRISLTHKIDENLDVLPYLKSRLTERNSLVNLRRAVAEHSTSPVSDIDALAKAVNDKPIFLDASKDDSGAPWINNPGEAVTGKLKILFDAISTNKMKLSEEVIAEINGSMTLTKHEQAEFLSLQAKILTLKGLDHRACELYESAYETYEISRYKVSYYESTFRLDEVPCCDVLNTYVKDLDESIDAECVLKAKCLALLERTDDALNVLNNLADSKAFIAKLMIFILVGDSNSFNEFYKNVKLDELDRRQQLLYEVFVGRFLFYKGIDWKNEEGEKYKIIPAKGKDYYNIDILQQSIAHIEQAMSYAKEEGFPSEVHIILDVAVPLFSMFNREEELIKYVESILYDRPDSEPLIKSLVPLKFNTRSYESVIDLINRVNEKNPDDISYLIAATYHAGSKNDVVELMDENRSLLLSKKPQNYESLFCMTAHCAYEIINEKKESEYLGYISEFENGEELIAIYDFVKNCNLYPTQVKDHKLDLYQVYLRLSKPVAIAQQLFHNLDVEDEVEANIICDLAETILSTRELYPDENKIYAFSLSLVKKWPELESLCDKISSTVGPDHLWSLLKASALDAQGHSNEALTILDDIVDRDRRSIERGEEYVNLCLRLGFFDKAEVKLVSLLEKSSPNNQINIIESLLFIYSADTEPSERLIPALIRYGQIVDKNDELQEGRYLMSFLTMTNRPRVDVGEYVDDFRDRLNDYSEKYPDSTILRRAEISTDAQGDQLLQEIQNISGVSQFQIDTWKKNRNLIRARKLPVPFAMLSNFLDDVGDVFTAWVLSKHYGAEKLEYQLVNSKLADDAVVQRIGKDNGQVVLDETALLVLYELDILDCFLSSVSSVVINKDTYEMFARSSHAIMGSIYSPIAKRIVTLLGDNLQNITLKNGGGENNLVEQYDNILKGINSSIMCTDDMYLSEFLMLSNHQTINSLNIIDWLHANDKVSGSEKVLLIEKLSSLGFALSSVGVAHAVECIEYNIGLNDGRCIMDTGFKHVFDAIFPIEKGGPQSFINLSSIFAGLLNNSDSDMDISNLDSILNVFFLRFSGNTRLKMSCVWFVNSCVATDYQPNSHELRIGKGHAKLYSLLKKVTVEFDEGLSQFDIFCTISEIILKLSPENASIIFDKIKPSFVDDSEESDLFSAIYTKKSIEYRLRESDL